MSQSYPKKFCLAEVILTGCTTSGNKNAGVSVLGGSKVTVAKTVSSENGGRDWEAGKKEKTLFHEADLERGNIEGLAEGIQVVDT